MAGRPRLYNTDEERKAAVARQRHARYRHHFVSAHYTPPDRADRSTAAYDPRRDAPAEYRDLTAFVFGDPPIGRSALDRKGI